MRYLLLALCFVLLSADEYAYQFDKSGVPVSRTAIENGTVELYSDLEADNKSIELSVKQLQVLKDRYAKKFGSKPVSVREMAQNMANKCYPEFDAAEFATALSEIDTDNSKTVKISVHLAKKGVFHWVEYNELQLLKKRYKNNH